MAFPLINYSNLGCNALSVQAGIFLYEPIQMCLKKKTFTVLIILS